MFISGCITAQTWTAHNVGALGIITSISFPTADTGYVVTDAPQIRKTINGAISWTPVSIPIPLTNIYFISGQKGFAFGDSILFMTTDGGTSWTQIIHDSRMFFQSMSFANSSIGYMLGQNAYTSSDSARLYKTINGGVSWTIISNVTSAFTESPVYFLNPATGFWAHNFDLDQTTNGGTSFSNVWNDPTFTDYLMNIYFPDIDTGYAVGFGTLIRTFDGGATWQSGTIPAYGVYDLYFVNGHQGFVCGGNGFNSGWVSQSNDAGASWTPSYTSVNSFYCMDFPNDSVGYVGGDNGTILKFAGTPNGITENANENEISIFPNPATGNVSMNNIPVGSEIKLLNISGEVIKAEMTESKSVKFDIQNISPGIYFVEITSGAEKIVKKLVVL